MKEKTPSAIFLFMAILCIGASGWVLGTDTNNGDFPVVLEPLTDLVQAQPSENASEEQSSSAFASVAPSDDPTLRVGGPYDAYERMLDNVPPDDPVASSVNAIQEQAGSDGQLSKIESDVGSDRAPVDAFHPTLKTGNRRTLSPVLKNSLLTVSTDGIWMIISDWCLLATGSSAEDVNEQDYAVSAQPPSETLGPLIIPYAIECLSEVSRSLWLAATPRASSITIEELKSSMLATQFLTALESFADLRLTSGPIGPYTLGATMIRAVSQMLAAGFVIFVLVMIGRLIAAQPRASDGVYNALRISWDSPFEGGKAFPVDDGSTAITIGSSKFDTVYSPELVAGHVRIGLRQDVLTLTCYGPIGLEDGSVLMPSGERPLAETFRSDRAVSFVAGESGFVLERVSIFR